jgi:hypothetical protein
LHKRGRLLRTERVARVAPSKKKNGRRNIVVSANAERNMMNGADTMIIGAGPYRLSLAAHLRRYTLEAFCRTKGIP